jgi:hypothetical protein
MFIAGCAITSVVIAGQSAPTSMAGANGVAEKHVVPATAEECTAKNGSWLQAFQGTVVNYGPFRCLNYETADGGKSCQDETECQGGCAPIYDKEQKAIGGKCYGRVNDYCFHEQYNHGVVSRCVY